MKIHALLLAAMFAGFLGLNAPAITYYVDVNSPNPTPPYTNWSTASTDIQSAVNLSTNGDLVLVNDGVYGAGSQTADKPFGQLYFGQLYRVAVSTQITLQSVNGPGATLINGGGQVACVYLTNNAVLNGFTITNGTASGPGTCGVGVSCQSNSLVINCLLINNNAENDRNSGVFFGTLTNCTITGTFLGPGAAYSALFNCSIIRNEFYGAMSSTLNNCFICSNGNGGAVGCTLSNCIVTNNFGLGILGGSAINCQLVNNIVTVGQVKGGGAYQANLTNCLLAGNQDLDEAGGATASTLVNCTVVNNSTTATGGGGGVYNCSLYNCIVYYNTGSPASDANYDGGTAMNTCTFPMFGSGYGNFTNPPLFLNGSNNFCLQSNSPCINAGNNLFISTGTDLDDNPRIVGGTVDMGAYEYQTPASVISYAWLQQYGLPTDGSVDYADLDGTAFNVHQDWISGLDPTNAASVLAMFPPTVASNSSGVAVSWQSVTGITYDLLRSTNLTAQSAFATIQTNITGLAGTTSYTDTTATNNILYFYRVGVQQ